jgi:hypothetical protein
MDAVDPALVARAEQVLRETPGVLGTGEVRLRWIGHRLRAECEVIVDPAATVVEAHQVTVGAEHALLHAIPQLSGALVHADPQPRAGADDHAVLASHRPARVGSPGSAGVALPSVPGRSQRSGIDGPPIFPKPTAPPPGRLPDA